MNRELGQTFQAFVLEGRTPIPFKTPLEDVQRALGTSTTYTIDQNYGANAVYQMGWSCCSITADSVWCNTK